MRAIQRVPVRWRRVADTGGESIVDVDCKLNPPHGGVDENGAYQQAWDERAERVVAKAKVWAQNAVQRADGCDECECGIGGAAHGVVQPANVAVLIGQRGRGLCDEIGGPDRFHAGTNAVSEAPQRALKASCTHVGLKSICGTDLRLRLEAATVCS